MMYACVSIATHNISNFNSISVLFLKVHILIYTERNWDRPGWLTWTDLSFLMCTSLYFFISLFIYLQWALTTFTVWGKVLKYKYQALCTQGYHILYNEHVFWADIWVADSF